jgi:hypothetical protein
MLVPDASVPTRLSGLSDIPCHQYGIASAMPFLCFYRNISSIRLSTVMKIDN